MRREPDDVAKVLPLALFLAALAILAYRLYVGNL